MGLKALTIIKEEFEKALAECSKRLRLSHPPAYTRYDLIDLRDAIENRIEKECVEVEETDHQAIDDNMRQSMDPDPLFSATPEQLGQAAVDYAKRMKE